MNTNELDVFAFFLLSIVCIILLTVIAGKDEGGDDNGKHDFRK